MRDEDLPRFARLLGNVLKYYRQELTEFTLDVWTDACRGFDLEQVDRALRSHVAHPDRGQFPPRLADLTRALLGSGVDRAVVAWGKVYDAMRRVGAWADVVFDDPVIHVVVTDMGGWPKVARVENGDLSITQHRFMEMYRSVSERGADGYPRVLQGARAADEEYERHGLPAPAPTLIGDATRCAEVFSRGGDARVELTFLRPGQDPATLLRLPGGLSLRQLPAAPPSQGAS